MKMAAHNPAAHSHSAQALMSLQADKFSFKMIAT